MRIHRSLTIDELEPRLSPAVIFVDIDAAGANDGSSWGDAYVDLQDALGAAQVGDEIWAAEGRYIPGAERTDTFQLLSGVSLYGGFAGTESILSERDWTVHVTTLSGDVNGDDVGFSNNDENVYHVVTGADDGTIDGFTITGGNANAGTADDHKGGGMVNVDCCPTVANCVFEGNSAASYGGGMWNMGWECRVAVQDCTFAGNRTEIGDGAGVYNSASSSTFSNCVFVGNSGGGGMYNAGACPVVTQCVFTGNTADGSAGGMSNSGSSPTVTDCVFSGNSGRSGGGMSNRFGSSPIVTNCTFTGNSSTADGGAMENQLGSSPTLINCAFTGNSSGADGGAMENYDSCSPMLTHCTFTGNSSGADGGAIGNIYSSSPILINCTFTGNCASGGGGAMDNIWGSSPTVTNCTFVGNSAGSSGGAIDNWDHSSPQITNSVFSQNSTAKHGGAIDSSINCAVKITNCTFVGNSAGWSGGALSNSSSSSPRVTNCIFWDNAAADFGDQVYSIWGSRPVFRYCTIQGSPSGAGWDDLVGRDGGHNSDADPLFVDPLDPAGPDGIHATGDDGLRLQLCSPCIDAGTRRGAPDADLLGIARPQRNGIDMGAYENARALILTDSIAPTDDRTIYFNAAAPAAPGEVGNTAAFTITNNAAGDLTIASVSLADGTCFNITGLPGPTFVLAHGESVTATVTFTPGGMDIATDTITILSDDADEPSLDIALVGTGITPRVLGGKDRTFEFEDPDGDSIRLLFSGPGEAWVADANGLPLADGQEIGYIFFRGATGRSSFTLTDLDQGASLGTPNTMRAGTMAALAAGPMKIVRFLNRLGTVENTALTVDGDLKTLQVVGKLDGATMGIGGALRALQVLGGMANGSTLDVSGEVTTALVRGAPLEPGVDATSSLSIGGLGKRLAVYGSSNEVIVTQGQNDILSIALGEGDGSYPQYAALHESSGYYRLNPGPGSAWGTSVSLLPALWTTLEIDGKHYHQGAAVDVTRIEVNGADVMFEVAGTIATLDVTAAVTLHRPAVDSITSEVSVAVAGSVALDVAGHPCEAFRPVFLSSMHISADQWDCDYAYVGVTPYAIPSDGWIVTPTPPATTGTVFGLQGGDSLWKTNAPTIEITLDAVRDITGWVMPSSDPNDDNVGFWCATDAILNNYSYTIVAKSA